MEENKDANTTGTTVGSETTKFGIQRGILKSRFFVSRLLFFVIGADGTEYHVDTTWLPEFEVTEGDIVTFDLDDDKARIVGVIDVTKTEWYALLMEADRNKCYTRKQFVDWLILNDIKALINEK